MAQMSSATEERKQHSEAMKSSLGRFENKTEAVSATATTKALKAERPLKLSISDSHMKRLQSHAGFSHHPYVSAHPCTSRLDLNIASRDNLSSFTQRVMSAKLLRLKQLQNQLSEAHLQLNELCTENRLLRALQKRQDLALDRYEGSQAQLPQLVRSHQEEVRVLRTKYKNLKLQFRSVTNTLKDKEAELQNLKEQHAHLLKLSKDRSLPERETLTKHVNELQKTVDNQSNTIQVLNRRILLETKNLKFQLQQEMQRRKSTQSELQQTFLKLDQLQSQLDQIREKSVLPPSMDRLYKNTSLRLTGSQKPTQMAIEKNTTPMSRLKNVSKNIEGITTSSNTEPSSVQFGISSPGTSSGKTNEYSVSYDSSPELTLSKTTANDVIVSAAAISDSFEFHKTVLPKGRKNHNTYFDSKKNKRVTEASKDNGSLGSDMLEKEYENAVAMLTELSTKHTGHFDDDTLPPPRSLDFSSAKHVAALANSTFSLNEKLQSAIQEKLDEEAFYQNVQAKQEELKVANNNHNSSLVESTKEERTSITPGSVSAFNASVLSSQNVSKFEKNSVTPKPHYEIEHDLLVMNKSCIPNRNTVNLGCAQEISRNIEEEMEASRKEALLKALKAIDDSACAGNNSDEDESSTLKLSHSVVPPRIFSPLNSTSVKSGSKSEQKTFK